MINLFYNYYEDKNPDRRKEIDFCYQKNLDNKSINVISIESQNRLKYKDYFSMINKSSLDNDINIICNSDIFFNETIEQVYKIKANEVYALSRWDYNHNVEPVLFNRPDSQDVWIFYGKVKEVYGDFFLGMPGCDNRIAYELNKAGYSVYNPSLSIKSYHFHNSGIRNYTRSDTVPGPYLHLSPVNVRE